MARVARSVAEVIAGEAGGRTRAARYNDMRHIASVIANRAAQLGVTPEQVVSRQSEFNAYGKRMPGGTADLVGLAEDAMREVQTAGPVTSATFYATPAAKGNLPKGLQRETKTASHVYFTDPQNRAVYTSAGLRTPAVAGRAKLGKPADSYDVANLPTPTPRDVTLASTMPSRPITPTPAPPTQVASNGGFGGLLSSLAANVESGAARLGGLIGPSAAAAAERPAPSSASRGIRGLLAGTSLASMRSVPTTSGNERARGLVASLPAAAPMSAEREENVAGRLASAFADAPASGRTNRITSPATTMSPEQAANVAGRLDAAFSGPAATTAPAARPAALSLVSPAAAATMPTPSAAPANPFSGGLLSDAAMSAINSRPAGLLSGNERARSLQQPDLPTMTPNQALDADVAEQRAINDARRQAAIDAAKQPQTQPMAPATRQPAVRQPAAPVAALPAPVTVTPQTMDRPATAARAPTEAQTRANVEARNPLTGQPVSTGLGLPSIPAAPAPGSGFGRLASKAVSLVSPAAGGLLGLATGDGSFRNRDIGQTVGGLLGAIAAGPIGGLLGGYLGNRIGNSTYGTPSNAASAALNAGWDGFSGMTSAQAAAARNAANGGGGGGGFGLGSLFSGNRAPTNSKAGGFGGFSSGASGPDGGKVR
ncbi:cell wall hydrolase [Aureimonas leprariae]|uniref:Uncharacterized protein n=1 Tax=Plantimonas leprariae TaxID=2615207 RepID=A0A7V7U055_9HYPH|nr:cell wall hydrolase [Aureimonas leprariae]KAB0680076.1 hypothetical protein F6X38_09710 [Aureimonas leprariae]